MSNRDMFDPIGTAKQIEDLYRDYIASTIHFDDPDLQRQLRDILNRRSFLAKGPFLEATPPYVKGVSLRELVNKNVLCEGMLDLKGFDPDRPLYAHQVNAIKKAKDGKNYIVVTGTGSGKTECFLLPIINDILEEFSARGHTPGVRALILYPMNALANDQLKRLRQLLDGTGITFGRYTGDTPETQTEALKVWSEENPDAYLPRPRGYIAMSTSRSLGAVNDRYLQNIGYLRLKNLTFGYSLPEKAVKKAGISKLRFYFSGENLFYLAPGLHSKYIDPEMAMTNGNLRIYPWQKTFMFGVDITL